jgi:hypothetical protein
MPKWRKATWALVIWTGLMALWIISGIAGVSNNCAGLSGDDLELCQAGTAIGGGIGITFIFFIWFLGFVILGIIWLMSRPKENVIVYGPQGQQVTVTEKEAQQRVASGWTYQPAAAPPVTPAAPAAPTPPPAPPDDPSAPAAG